MRLLVDMNLPPLGVAFLAAHGVDAVHGPAVGGPRAKDTAVREWARGQGDAAFTHDLDFSALMAASIGVAGG